MAGILSGAPESLLAFVYLVAGILFIQGLRDMTHPRTATRGNQISSVGMFLAVGITVLWFEILSPVVLAAALLVGGAIGAWLAVTVETTEMPQLVGLFNGFGGGASALVAGAELVDQFNLLGASVTLPLGLTATAAIAGIIGSVTFWGSLVAAGKLHGLVGDSPVSANTGHGLKIVSLLVAVLAGLFLILQPEFLGTAPLASWIPSYWALVVAASLLGVFLVVPIGGADMPVVIALLNSYSGLAAATTGFVLNNSVLIIAGTLVGASGLILTVIMCESMNRSLTNVLFGGFGESGETEDMEDIYEGNITETSPEEVVMLLEIAQRVVLVPGYGMAVAQAQHAFAELAELLEENDVDVEFGIHPVAGRMPGHMNALLAEADVSYEKMRELEEVNPTFSKTDVVIISGANDVVNPLANTDESSPIAGMPVLNVSEAQNVIVNKRSLSPGFSGVPNPLFANDNTSMLFGDAKQSIQDLVGEYKERTS
ncbi:NAD(P)(+) transhydrogenase (Re/Si-specific) subunit beta [Salinibaculum salinum]|uniref:NAD(P)(+) transhydrogenase (Re/Si-specific) subunit beta n=1 Tax=Salinibaculum salinum TaxID=3131996 RepID=UPI0030EB185A